MVQYEKRVTWRVQHEKRATWRNINCHSELWKKCTRIVHFGAQTDNGPFVDGLLYTGKNLSIYLTEI